MTFNQVCISTDVGGGNYSLDWDPERWASILDMNCNIVSDTEAILYKGSDSTTGLGLKYNGTQLEVYGLAAGRKVDSRPGSSQSNVHVTKEFLYYAKSNAGCAFGFGDINQYENINYYWSTGTYLDTGKTAYCYVIDSRYANFTLMITSDGDYEYPTAETNISTNDKMVVLIPAVMKTHYFVCNNGYITEIFASGQRAARFMIDNNTYVSSSKSSDTVQRFCLRL